MHATETFLGAPRAPARLLVGLELAVDDAGEAPLQGPDCFLLRFAFSEFAFVEDTFPSGAKRSPFKSGRPDHPRPRHTLGFRRVSKRLDNVV